jgi:hypothetical protein
MLDDDDVDTSESLFNNVINHTSSFIEEHKLKSFFDFKEKNNQCINIMHVNCRSIKKITLG